MTSEELNNIVNKMKPKSETESEQTVNFISFLNSLQHMELVNFTDSLWGGFTTTLN